MAMPPPSVPPPLPKKRSGWRHLLWIVPLAGVGLFGLLWLMDFGMDLVAEQVAEDLRGNPVIQEHIGEVQEIRHATWASLSKSGMDDYVFEVRGDKGSGELHVTLETIDADTERVLRGTLEMDGDRIYNLFPPGR